MQQDKNRNEIVAPLTLADRKNELLALPKAGDAPVIEYGEKIYQFLSTDDGSPSIRMTDIAQRPEAMHHSGGALAESIFIYGEALREGLNILAPPRILSVGLGCGYNEWIGIAEILRHRSMQADGALPADFYMESFEADDTLRCEFINFLEKEAATSELGALLHTTFDSVITHLASSYDLSAENLSNLGRKLYNDGRWVVRGRLDSATKFEKTFGAIFFDAFSTKATPDLWHEEFLNRFLQAAAARPCVLATYAAVGALNRSLKRADFELTEQPGFQFKRESTRAFRRTKNYGTVPQV